MKLLKSKALFFCTMTLLASLTSHSLAQDSVPELKIVKDDLQALGYFYFVKGIIYNPYSRPVKNVNIRYYVWKKWMGKDGHGSVIKETGGLVEANIKYIPPKQTVDFTAPANGTAPVMSLESGLVPDPLSAEITAEWDK